MWQEQDHQKRISALFSGRTTYDGARICDEPLVLIAFTNRCGSNLLAEYLTSTGRFPHFEEYLNGGVVANMLASTQATSFPGYIEILRARLSRGRTFALKASWDQIWMLLQWRIPAMFSGIRVIHMTRRDIVGQAISFSIAAQTHRWKSFHEGSGKEPAFEPDDISARIEGIAGSNARIEQICAIAGIDRMALSYEELLHDPEKVVADILFGLGLPAAAIDAGAIKLEKQGDATNERFREQYLAWARKRLRIDTPPPGGSESNMSGFT